VIKLDLIIGDAMEKERALNIISNEVKNQICNLEVLTPDIFTTIFLEKAKEHNVEIDQKLIDEYINKKFEDLQKVQQKTHENADKLSKTASKAINAIKEKDDNLLNNVLKETVELRREVEKLKESLYKDELTTTYNRKWLFDNLLDKENFEFLNSGVLALIDLNYFKLVNDTYGHIVGDKVLVFISSQLKKTKANVIRYGGDEFILIFENKQEIDVEKLLTKLRNDILKKHLKVKNNEFKISFSIGITSYNEKENLEVVVERADKKMYEDKIKIKEKIKGIDV
jgi:diguanylate cyclase (GGDEF)-like protein